MSFITLSEYTALPTFGIHLAWLHGCPWSHDAGAMLWLGFQQKRDLRYFSIVIPREAGCRDRATKGL